VHLLPTASCWTAADRSAHCQPNQAYGAGRDLTRYEIYLGTQNLSRERLQDLWKAFWNRDAVLLVLLSHAELPDSWLRFTMYCLVDTVEIHSIERFTPEHASRTDTEVKQSQTQV
jgi:hypothetical protein